MEIYKDNIHIYVCVCVCVFIYVYKSSIVHGNNFKGIIQEML